MLFRFWDTSHWTRIAYMHAVPRQWLQLIVRHDTRIIEILLRHTLVVFVQIFCVLRYGCAIFFFL